MRYRDAMKLRLGDEVVDKNTGEIRIVLSVSSDGGTMKYLQWADVFTTDYYSGNALHYFHDEVM